LLQTVVIVEPGGMTIVVLLGGGGSPLLNEQAANANASATANKDSFIEHAPAIKRGMIVVFLFVFFVASRSISRV